MINLKNESSLCLCFDLGQWRQALFVDLGQWRGDMLIQFFNLWQTAVASVAALIRFVALVGTS
ncbi:hypothetical protein HanIR_Chr04g0187081 [Helianthus annuus]|nr:hypothetical protein HanIR_Chr04g0187081 [Helianthus annuus]